MTCMILFIVYIFKKINLIMYFVYQDLQLFSKLYSQILLNYSKPYLNVL